MSERHQQGGPTTQSVLWKTFDIDIPCQYVGPCYMIRFNGYILLHWFTAERRSERTQTEGRSTGANFGRPVGSRDRVRHMRWRSLGDRLSYGDQTGPGRRHPTSVRTRQSLSSRSTSRRIVAEMKLNPQLTTNSRAGPGDCRVDDPPVWVSRGTPLRSFSWPWRRLTPRHLRATMHSSTAINWARLTQDLPECGLDSLDLLALSRPTPAAGRPKFAKRQLNCAP